MHFNKYLKTKSRPKSNKKKTETIFFINELVRKVKEMYSNITTILKVYM